MAMTYDPKKKLEEQQANAQAQVKQAQTAASAQAAQPYTAIKGTSAATQQQLGKLQAGYQPSETVSGAMNYLKQLQQQKPGSYTSPYTEQLNGIYEQIMNRKPFQYDLNGDMLYQQYKDQYMLNGQQAMMDTIGQAAQYTGGYGSSYGATAGNQAYQQYLTQLNAIIPELYDRAAARYDQAGRDLMDQYGLAQSAENQGYSRYMDAMNQWNADVNAGLNAYNTFYNQDYGQYSDMLNYWLGQAQMENSGYLNEQSNAYTTAMTMLKSGAMPSGDLLGAAGISQADAQAILAALAPKKSGGSGSSKKTDTKNLEAAVAGSTKGTVNNPLRGLTYKEASLIDNAGKVQEAAEKTGNPQKILEDQAKKEQEQRKATDVRVDPWQMAEMVMKKKYGR